ncbi:D-arabinono-1,4-lactone oxidase [Antrihabitans sp. YC2-6]|uniref:D-arabinono-1,4-lactone oxidase n=1 Tax=Antrihabitans sp. YC2-6 TaxID=2799498 RepID=UPI0018F6293E|nr:D-arabinono-1,4-lactone oxidase [Antrihabitans sp. YC2-6]MBJ8343549.1 FAD-binding protein [Antrihabitans sp. YC2-6]
MTNSWTNWAGDQACSPAAVEHPADRSAVARLVQQAHAANRTVRVAGAGHSFTDTVLTDGVLLSLDRMNRVLDIDRSTGSVRVEAGITLNKLSSVLHDYELALPNLGDIDVQSIAGATATATHGTGAKLENLSAALQSIELTLADGSTIEVDEQSDPDAWRAARVSIGALGVITAFTVQAVPAFVLEAVDRPQPLDDVLAQLDSLADGNDHFEFFAFPHSPVALTRTNNRTDLPENPPSALSNWVQEIALANYAFGALCRLGRVRPRLIPRINRTVTRLAGSTHRVDRSYRIFASPRRVRMTEMEYAIPRAYAAEAIRQVKAVGERPEFDVSFPIEVRWVAPDDAFLSPANGRPTCYLAVHMYRGMAWEPYFRAVEEVMASYGGRPHWGKRHFQTAETLRPLYPEWDRFAAVRKRLDPDGLFTNGYVERVLGPTT